MTALVKRLRLLLPKSLLPIGTPDSQTPRLPMPSWIAPFIPPTGFPYQEILRESCEDSAPCRTPNVTIFSPVFSISLLCDMPRVQRAISPESARINNWGSEYQNAQQQ